MTAWDFADHILSWFDQPGFADGLFRIIVVILVILIIIEVLPGKWKPLSRMAHRLGNQLNADVLDKVTKIEKRTDKTEKDIVRLQLLVLLADYSENEQEIMEVAHHYFVDIEGDWYMTKLFNKWLIENNEGEPEWFNPNK